MGSCLNDADSVMYYNITLQVFKCACMKTVFEEDFERDKYVYPTKHLEQPEYEKSLFSRIQNFFDTGTSKTDGTASAEIPVHSRQRDVEEEYHCQSIQNYSLKVIPWEAPNSLRSLILSVLLCTIFTVTLVLLVLSVRRRIAIRKNKNKIQSEIDPTVDESNPGVQPVETLQSVLYTEKPSETTENRKTSLSTKETTVKYEIKLAYQLCVFDGLKMKFDVAEFLNGTVDKLFSKLDRMLISTPAPSSSLAATATPRLARRSLHRRQRIGSSPSLQLYDTAPEPSAATRLAGNADWKRFKQFCNKMGWKEPLNPKVNETNVQSNDQHLLQYFQRVCPISHNIWTCSTMITNYALILLEMELSPIVSSKGYRFIDMVPSGSATQGTKVGLANQFDILLILQPSILPCGVVHMDKDNRVPPGHVLINAQTDTAASLLNQGTLCQLELPDTETPYFLSASEFCFAAEELIDKSLRNLYTSNRMEVDRLPFKISRSSSANLDVTIDTRGVVGLGLSDIKIAIHPVLVLPLQGWFQDIPIYAAPPPVTDGAQQGTKTRKSAIPNDFLWSLNFSEVHSSYLKSIDLKMRHAGITSCHMTLLMILKSLFTGCIRNNLLDRGELLTTHITHVISFLMLESSPQQWTFDHLADRFSDVVHFLQDAYQNERLPHFFLNNPHLIKNVAFVANNPLFKSARQYNILSDVPNKEKCVQYMDKCLRESGLKSCVNQEYSPDMWEYEFFVY